MIEDGIAPHRNAPRRERIVLTASGLCNLCGEQVTLLEKLDVCEKLNFCEKLDACEKFNFCFSRTKKGCQPLEGTDSPDALGRCDYFSSSREMITRWICEVPS